MGWNFNLSAWYQHSQLEELEELVSPIWRSFDWKVLPNPLGPWIVFFIPIKIEITCRYRVHCQTHPYSYNLQQTIANTTRYRKTVHIGAEDHRASAGITCHYHWWNVTTMWHRWENIWSIWYFGLLRACRWLWAPVIRLYFVFSMPKALSLSQPFLGWWFQLCAQYLSHTMLLTLQTASNVQSVLDVISVLKKNWFSSAYVSQYPSMKLSVDSMYPYRNASYASNVCGPSQPCSSIPNNFCHIKQPP